MRLFNPLKVKRMASSPVVECVRQIIEFGRIHKLRAMQISREYDRNSQWEKVLLYTADSQWRFVILVLHEELTVTIYHEDKEVAHVQDIENLDGVLGDVGRAYNFLENC